MTPDPTPILPCPNLERGIQLLKDEWGEHESDSPAALARAELAALRARCAEWEAECQWLVEKMNRIVGAVRIDGASEILWRDVATIAAERRALSAPQPDAEERGAVE